jgi:hypothetical protein
MLSAGNFEDAFLKSMDAQGLLSIYTQILKDAGIPKVPINEWNSMKAVLKATLNGMRHFCFFVFPFFVILALSNAVILSPFVPCVTIVYMFVGKSDRCSYADLPWQIVLRLRH